MKNGMGLSQSRGDIPMYSGDISSELCPTIFSYIQNNLYIENPDKIRNKISY